MSSRPLDRILDANFNRAREGLRVCEELCRFVLDAPGLTRRLKTLRHRLADELRSGAFDPARLARARDSRSEVGRGYDRLESKRDGLRSVFIANIERVKESLRVLEEISKTVDGRAPARFKSMRFTAYAIEKTALRQLEALCDHDDTGRAGHRGARPLGRQRRSRRRATAR